MTSTIESCQGEIFQLYIVQGRTLEQVREILRHEKGLDISRKILNTKLRNWGYLKNYKRSEHIAILREKKTRGLDGKLSSFTRQGRPIDMKKIEAYGRRERVHLITQNVPTKPNQTLPEDMVCRTPPPGLPQGLPSAYHWRASEKFLYDSDVLVKRSFETGLWSFNGKDHLITSCPTQDFELTTLNEFLGDLKIGCAAACNRDLDLAGRHWQRAFSSVETLVSGRYYDILPNLVQQINDVNSRGFPDLARLLKCQIADLSAAKAQTAPIASVLESLGQVDMDFMIDLEQRLMQICTKLFELYLGPLCYGSFVIMMDTAHRKLLQSPWSNVEDLLPSVSCLSDRFGGTDRRPLDVIGLRLEILHLKGSYAQVELEASDLIMRAQTIHDDEWQQLYHLTRGWYHLGHAQYSLGTHDLAQSSFTNFSQSEQELSKRDSFSIFEAQKVIARRCQDQMETWY